MDNLTHSLVGVLVAKTGLERLSPYAIAAAVVSANAPDLDLIATVGGRWSYLEHHRGITHSIVGVAVISLLVTLCFWLLDRLLAKRLQQAPRVKVAGLTVVCLIATATHPILDWTNNYGIRPFLPWSDQWYYGDLVFVFDPWLWLLLGGAAFVVTANSRARIFVWTILGTILSATILIAGYLGLPAPDAISWITIAFWLVGFALVWLIYRSRPPWLTNEKLATVALLIVPIYWSGLASLHSRAVDASARRAVSLSEGEAIVRVSAMPMFGNPFRWQSLAESDRAIYRFTQVLNSTPSESPISKRYAKPDLGQVPLVEEASKNENALVFLRFARFPLARVAGKCPQETVVRFADLRYTEPGSSRGPFALEVPVRCPDPPLK
ncbi:MAG: metal-dependent hydrolase [Pyrinomonadaceae bacterium]